MISISELTFAYDNQLVLSNLNIDLKAGCVHGILGPNGSGKTTFLDVLSGMLPPDSGAIKYNDDNLTYHHLAYLEAELNFYPLLTGREHLNIYARRNPSFNVGKWNELFDIPLDDLIETYSSGMKKKLGFLSVLCQDKPVVLLDEPFNNLDVDSNLLVTKLLSMMAEKGKLIILTSHILEILTNMTDYIHVLQKGKITQTIIHENFESWKKTYREQEMNELLEKARNML